MAHNRGTQKQIAQRFKGNLDYFRKPHYWRRIRFWTILIVSLVGAAAIAAFYFGGKETIYNPGAISVHHARFAEDCQKCHEAPKRLLAGATIKLSNAGIDQRCEKCHAGFSFHETNVVHARSCTTCHQEHQGSGAMAAPDSSQCARCHANAHEMAASAEKGRALPAAVFAKASFGWKPFNTPRPAGGFTATINSFETDHPEFRLLADKLRDSNTLKFNHRRHLVETNDMPLVDGKRLECASCHQTGPRGAFFQPVRFDQHCRVCHTLQFDEHNPALTLPHGQAEHVRAFLRSLPVQYADLASKGGAKTHAEVEAAVAANLLRLREQFIDGTNLERQVFFTTFRKGPHGRAKFDGCAGCHEVGVSGSDVPTIAKPEMPDRWLPRAHFTHAKHATMACAKCHNAAASADTADIIMPAKATCVECHSAKGKVSSDCASCHSYHAPQQIQTMTTMR
jgi:predicted CXXCH cytochrome family protein